MQFTPEQRQRIDALKAQSSQSYSFTPEQRTRIDALKSANQIPIATPTQEAPRPTGLKAMMAGISAGQGDSPDMGNPDTEKPQGMSTNEKAALLGINLPKKPEGIIENVANVRNKAIVGVGKAAEGVNDFLFGAAGTVGDAAGAKLAEGGRKEFEQEDRDMIAALNKRTDVPLSLKREIGNDPLAIDRSNDPTKGEAIGALMEVGVDLSGAMMFKAISKPIISGYKLALKQGGKTGVKQWAKQLASTSLGKKALTLAGSTALGATLGVSGGLQQGETGAELVDNALIGGGVGLALPLAGTVLSKVLSKKVVNTADIQALADRADVDNATARQIAGKQELYDEYLAVVEKRNDNLKEISPTGYAVDKFRNDIITPIVNKEQELGRAVGAAKTRMANEVLGEAEIVKLDKAFDDLLNAEGLQRQVSDDGVVTIIEKAGGVGTVAPEELSDILLVIEKMKKNPTIDNLNQVIKFIDNNASVTIDASGKARNMDLYDRVASQIRKPLSDARKLRMTDEEMQTFELYGLLRDILDPKKRPMYKQSGTPRLSEVMAGGNPLTGLKRLMSERDIDSKNVIKGLSDELGIDLEQYTLDNMAMAEVVTKMFGDDKQRALLSQDFNIGIEDVAGAAVTNGGNLLPRVVMGMVNVFRQSPEAALNKIISAPRQTALVKNLEIFKDMTPDSAKYAEVRKNISDELAVIQAKLDKTKSDEITREVQKQIDDFNNILALPSPSGQVSADVVNLKTIIPRQNRDALKGGTSTSRSLPESAESGLSPEAGIQTKSQPLGGSTKKQSKVSSSKDIIPKDSTKAKPSAKVGGMNNLETEAKKFKTADEFVEDKHRLVAPAKEVDFAYPREYNREDVVKTMYKSMQNRKDVTMPKGVYVTRGAKGDGTGNWFTPIADKAVTYAKVTPNGKVTSLDISSMKFAPTESYGRKVASGMNAGEVDKMIKRALGDGYDGLYSGGNLLLPTKSQLTDIWNKANKPVNKLETEAKKFKTADEFVENANTTNPTGGLFVDYTPNARTKIPLGDNIQTLDMSIGGNPDDVITIYRGTTGGKINNGDFITTNDQLAKDYAGAGKVVELKVRKGDIIDMVDESGGEEYIYRVGADKEPRHTKDQLTDIWNKANKK